MKRELVIWILRGFPLNKSCVVRLWCPDKKKASEQSCRESSGWPENQCSLHILGVRWAHSEISALRSFISILSTRKADSKHWASTECTLHPHPERFRGLPVKVGPYRQSEQAVALSCKIFEAMKAQSDCRSCDWLQAGRQQHLPIHLEQREAPFPLSHSLRNIQYWFPTLNCTESSLTVVTECRCSWSIHIYGKRGKFEGVTQFDILCTQTYLNKQIALIYLTPLLPELLRQDLERWNFKEI